MSIPLTQGNNGTITLGDPKKVEVTVNELEEALKSALATPTISCVLDEGLEMEDFLVGIGKHRHEAFFAKREEVKRLEKQI